MLTARLKRRTLVTAAALGMAVAPVIAAPRSGLAAHAAVPDTIPLRITNSSGRSEPVYVYNLGTQLSTGRQGWADANGVFHA